MTRKGREMEVMVMLIVGIVLLMTIQITPSSAQSSPGENCWEAYTNCVLSNQNRSASDPHLNPGSPSFNETEFICCPLLQQISTTEKQCFCVMNTVIHQNASLAPNVILLFSTCNIVDSVPALDNFCQGEAPTTPTTKALPLQAGEAPSPSPASAPTPVPAFLGDPSLLQAGIKESKGSAGSAANKITMIGSLSGLFVLLTHVLIL